MNRFGFTCIHTHISNISFFGFFSIVGYYNILSLPFLNTLSRRCLVALLLVICLVGLSSSLDVRSGRAGSRPH